MGGKSSAPAAPDPYKVSDAQTQSNQQTAQFNAGLNRYNQYTPLGNETWSQTMGADGKTPQWASTISLSPMAQSTLDNNMKAANGLSSLQNQFQGNVSSQLAKPLDTSSIGYANQAAQDAVYNRAKNTLDPQYQQQQTALSSQLANQGITQGSDAYNTAMNNFARQRDSAYENARNDSITQGDQYGQQMLQQLLALRNQPMDELNALRTGSQVQMPSFSQTPGVSAPGTNLSGNVYNSYQGQLDAASSGNAGSNALMGGLFSLGGSLGSAYLMSDRRTKADVVELGMSAKGLPVYAFRYVWEEPGTRAHVGHMADEVEAMYPHAVHRGEDGFQRVNYGVLQ